MNVNIEELRRLANEATPGPWIAGGPSFGREHALYFCEVIDDPVDISEDESENRESVCCAPHGAEDVSSENMLYIAYANPATIRALLDELERVKAQMDELLKAARAVISVAPSGLSCRDFHHKKAHLHGDTERCPVLEEYELAEDALCLVVERMTAKEPQP